MTVQEYLKNNSSADIDAINSIFEPYGIKVDDIIQSSQIIRFKLTLPLDVKTQGKIRRAEKDIEYSLTAALKTDNIIYGKESDYIYVERKAAFNSIDFLKYIDSVPATGLNLFLGKDINGNNVFTNLSKAPHILVGGTTGSGKSELLHTMVASLIFRRKDHPSRIFIIDPKRAEFSVYKNHKDLHVITDMKEAVNRLKWACDEMESRYQTLEKNNCKDISELHNLSIIPIVFVVDEIADLLMQNDEAEQYIVRLAQKARACGIHLILGTQSPRRDIITGLIKANIPTKIALHTTNQMESRIILDQNGAEKLFGKGDMLYLGNGAFNPIRIQSAYLNQAAKEKIVSSLPYEAYIPVAIKEEPTPITNEQELCKHYREQGIDMEGALKRAREGYYTQQLQKNKKTGIIQGLKNLWNVKPIMFNTDDYPPRI